MLPGYKLFGIIDIYYSFHVLGFICLTIVALWLCKKYGIPRWKTLVIAALQYVSTYIWMMVLFWVASGFKTFGGQNAIRMYVWQPLFVILWSKIFKVNWRSISDITGPCTSLNFGISHIGCIFAGCCHGYESKFLGIYNATLNRYLFPVQICESVTTIAIAGYLIWRMKKKDYKTDGEIYPLMLILFGGTRFIWEFFRDNDKLFLGISELAIHALIMFIVGLCWYLTIKEYRDRKEKASSRKQKA